MRRRLVSAITVLTAAAILPACGSGPAVPSLLDPSQPRDPNPVVVISASGVSPKQSHVNRPVTVKFVNNDGVAHRVAAAPELGYGDCPEVNAAGLIGPGQTSTATITSEGVCGFHDFAQPANPAFQGYIVAH